eukprot:1932450-Rhodomonas_salina.10
MSGTDLAYAGVAVYLCCYAMSATDIAHAGVAVCEVRYCHSVCRRMFLRACYAMSGTDMVYAATRGPLRLKGV